MSVSAFTGTGTTTAGGVRGLARETSVTPTGGTADGGSWTAQNHAELVGKGGSPDGGLARVHRHETPVRFLITQGFSPRRMPVVPNRVTSHEGSLQTLSELLSTGEDWLMCLYNSPITPAEGDTASTYTAHEAAFGLYARRVLKRGIGPGAWTAPVLRAPSGTPPWSPRDQIAYSEAPLQSWVAAGKGDTVHGYFVLGATSGRLLWAEQFDLPCSMTATSTMSITPTREHA